MTQNFIKKTTIISGIIMLAPAYCIASSETPITVEATPSDPNNPIVPPPNRHRTRSKIMSGYISRENGIVIENMENRDILQIDLLDKYGQIIFSFNSEEDFIRYFYSSRTDTFIIMITTYEYIYQTVDFY